MKRKFVLVLLFYLTSKVMTSVCDKLLVKTERTLNLCMYECTGKTFYTGIETICGFWHLLGSWNLSWAGKKEYCIAKQGIDARENNSIELAYTYRTLWEHFTQGSRWKQLKGKDKDCKRNKINKQKNPNFPNEEVNIN